MRPACHFELNRVQNPEVEQICSYQYRIALGFARCRFQLFLLRLLLLQPLLLNL